MPNNNGNGGRPSKLTPECKKLLLEAAKLGASDKDAALYAAVHPCTLSRWLKKGVEAKSGEYCEFYQDYTRARGIGNIELLKELLASKDDRTKIHLLALRDPAYNLKQRTEHQMEHSGKLEVVVKRSEVTEDDRPE